VSGSRDKTIRSWEVPGEALSAAGPLAQQIGTVQAVAVTRLPGGQTIAVTCSRTLVQGWDLANGGEPNSLIGHDSPVRCVAAAGLPDGEGALVAAIGWDGTIIAWSAADGAETGRGEIGDVGSITSMAAATLIGGRVVALAGDLDGDVRVWDLLTNEQAGKLRGHADVVVAVTTATADDGRTLVISGSRDGRVRIRDLGAHLDSGLPVVYQPVEADIGEPVASLAVAALANGRRFVVVGGEKGAVRPLDLRNGSAIGDGWRTHHGAVVAVAAAGRLDADRVVIFTAGEDPLVHAWDAITGKPVGEALPTPGVVRAMAYQAEPASLVIGGTGVAVACLRQGRN
jgi:WD40 repeat protein